jgi:hypothetical protein
MLIAAPSSHDFACCWRATSSARSKYASAGPYWPGDALEVLSPKDLQLEQIAEKFSCAFRNDHHVRLSHPLQACGEVQRFADDTALLCLTRSDQVADDNRARSNTDACLQGNARLQCGDCRNYFQPRLHSPLSVVLMRLRVAKIHEHAVAHVFGPEAAEAFDSGGDASLISRNDLAEVLRVMRADSAAEATKSVNIIVTWRRSAVSRGDASAVAGQGVAVGPALVSARRAAIASSNLRRCPTMPAPKSFGSSAVKLGRTVSSISFSRKAASYFPRPRLRSQTTTSMMTPLRVATGTSLTLAGKAHSAKRKSYYNNEGFAS